MQEVAQRTQLTFGAADKLFQFGDMTGHFVFVITRRMVRDIFGPVGVAAWIVGLVALVKRGRRVEIAALFACLVYLIVVSHGNRRHDYYQLALVPAGVIAIPAGILAIAQWARPAPAGGVDGPAHCGDAGVDDGGVVLRPQRELSLLVQRSIRTSSGSVRCCGPQLAPGELLVFADYTSPDVMYCLDRRGWLHQGPPMTVEQVREGGPRAQTCS